MELAPITLFTYNRPWHTKQTLEALSNNNLANQSILYIFCDGVKSEATNEEKEKVLEVRQIVKSRKWCKKVHIVGYKENQGLAKNIIAGVTQVVNTHGNVIVLEDDIVTSPNFLTYMNNALSLYENEEKVFHINGYFPVTSFDKKLPETFFLRFMFCWGWGTWKNAWSKVNWDTAFLYQEIMKPENFREFNLDGIINFHKQLEGNLNGSINTWAINWFSTVFLENGLCLSPKRSLVQNIGLDGSGVHFKSDSFTNLYKTNLAKSITVKKMEIEESFKGKKYLKRFYKYGKDSSLGTRSMYKVSRLLNHLPF